MNGYYLKKSYKGLVIWTVLFTAAAAAIGFLPIRADVMARIICCISLIACTVLMYVVYRNEAVYWFSGITYEQAIAVSPERRKLYAFKHFRLFGIYTLIYIVFSVIMQLVGVSVLADAFVLCASLLGICIRSMFYRL